MGLTRIRAEQISNIDYKQAVRVVTTTDVTLTEGAPVVVDGVTLVQGNRVLVTGQSTGSQNGIYVVQTLGTGEDGTWVRSTDANATGEIEPGMVVMVTEGTTYADTPWKLVTNGTIIVGTTPLTFQQFSSGANVGGLDTNIQFNSSGNLGGSNNLTWDGTELYVNAAANITGNVSGNYFFGNGSQLSGIITSVANINNGTSNVSIDAANANISMSVDGTADVVVVSAAGLTVNGNVVGNGIPVTTVSNIAPLNPEQGDIWINVDTGSQYIYFTAGGNSQWAEIEAEQSFSVSGSEVDLTAVNTDILPTANITYDIGNVTNRFRDIYLANSTIYLGEAEISATDGAVVLPANSTVGGAVVAPSPKITGFVYPGDDTAAAPAGGQTILINGINFESGCVVYIDNAVVSPVVFISSTQLSFTSPAKATGTYSLYVINPDGSSALALPGIQYSGVPDWSTAAGSLGTPYETNAFNTTLVATADSAVTYAVAPGNTLPANLTLGSSTGSLSGTIPVTNNDTTYTFSVRATDAENQDTDRQFNLTYKVDVVTWDAPANASSYNWMAGTANSVSLSATSAAGKSVSFAVQTGSLPANVTLSGNLISGTPNTAQSNTAVVLRATAADTNRFADRTLYFTVTAITNFVRQITGSQFVGIFDIGLDSEGNIYGTGLGPSGQGIIVKFNSTGDLQFIKTVSGATMTFRNIRVKPNGEFFIGGYVSYGSQYGFIIKFDSSGNVVWSNGVTRPNFIYDIFVDSDDNVWAVGGGQGDTGEDQHIIRFTSAGAFSAAWKSNDSRSNGLNSIFVDTDYIYVGGYQEYTNYGNEYNGFIAKLSKSNPTSVSWSKSISRQLGVLTDETVRAITVVGNDVYGLVIGMKQGQGIYEPSVFKLNGGAADPTSFTWIRKFVDASNTSSYGGRGSNIMVSGNTLYVGTTLDNKAFAAKYNTNGVLQWQRAFNLTSGSANFGGLAFAGDYFFTGMVNTSTYYASYVNRFNIDGTGQGTYTPEVYANTTYSEEARTEYSLFNNGVGFSSFTPSVLGVNTLTVTATSNPGGAYTVNNLLG